MALHCSGAIYRTFPRKYGFDMIDTHAHLTDRSYAIDCEDVIKRAEEAGLTRIICIPCELRKREIYFFKKMLSFDIVYGAAGIHPNDAKDYEKYQENFLGLLDLPKMVALGETGLDYHYLNSPAEIQKEVFEKQLAIAKGRNLPVIIHCREAFSDGFSILKNSGIEKVVIHCFSGSEKEAEEYLNAGFYISFAGPVTFKNAKNLKEIVKIIPEERLLLETDSPYLAPQAFRGKRNEPAYIKYIYEEVAILRNISVDKIISIVSENTSRIFGI